MPTQLLEYSHNRSIQATVTRSLSLSLSHSKSSILTLLTKTKTGYDAIVVFVDRLSKMVHLTPTHTTLTAKGWAELFLENVWKYHGLPEELVSDRGPQFCNKFIARLATQKSGTPRCRLIRGLCPSK